MSSVKTLDLSAWVELRISFFAANFSRNLPSSLLNVYWGPWGQRDAQRGCRFPRGCGEGCHRIACRGWPPFDYCSLLPTASGLACWVRSTHPRTRRFGRCMMNRQTRRTPWCVSLGGVWREASCHRGLGICRQSFKKKKIRRNIIIIKERNGNILVKNHIEKESKL